MFPSIYPVDFIYLFVGIAQTLTPLIKDR